MPHSYPARRAGTTAGQRAISWIKRHFREALSVGTLASEAAISPLALYQHFRNGHRVERAALSERLRLQEDLRLMLS
jgi:AraC-like DNA-binding protein